MPGKPQHSSTPRLGRFFLWNDMHLRDPFAVRNRRADTNVNEKAGWALSCATGHRPDIERPEFIVSAGDLVCGKSKHLATDYRFIHRQMLTRLPVPLMPCVGNHEVWQEAQEPGAESEYDRWHGPAWRNYVFTCSDVGFIVLDTSDGGRDIHAHRQRLRFFEAARAYLKTRSLFVISHFPLIPLRRPEVLSQGIKHWGYADPELLEAIEAASDQVLAVLCGHLHLTGMRRKNGIYHILPAGTSGYPAEFASFDIFADHVTVSIHAAPAAVLGDRGRDDLHGAGRAGWDLCDADYENHERYITGHSDERHFRIKIPSTVPLTGERTGLEAFSFDATAGWRRMWRHPFKE